VISIYRYCSAIERKQGGVVSEATADASFNLLDTLDYILPHCRTDGHVLGRHQSRVGEIFDRDPSEIHSSGKYTKLVEPASQYD
jgi:hypothetical protein